MSDSDDAKLDKNPLKDENSIVFPQKSRILRFFQVESGKGQYLRKKTLGDHESRTRS